MQFRVAPNATSLLGCSRGVPPCAPPPPHIRLRLWLWGQPGKADGVSWPS